MSDTVLKPGATIGILGGGQLGRMLAVAAAELGFRCHIYSPEGESPAFDVAAARTVSSYENESALAAFAGSVDVVTYEFENVPAATAKFLAEQIDVLPSPRALAISQDRLSEKELMQSLGIGVAPFARVDGVADLEAALDRLGRPAILKTRRLGYDGKGQVAIREGDDPAHAWDAVGHKPSVLEGFVSFAREVSALVVRGRSGETAVYDITENVHRNHILATSTVPAAIAPATADAARAIAIRVADALDYVGLLAVEMFVVETGGGETLLVNEIAPRVHNSGHWTQDGCLVSQFENHIRAVAGWPLGATERHSNAVMTNLVGAEADDWHRLAAEGGARLHLYGKSETRLGRKMGHVNRIAPKR
ncbi:5-(carboxyamino)imidazole ribonucleotide synthase [Kaistia dalseonensis]|uniref:N5-carboxyaminoimidazole ribonucleotide synthase n=1 Tax=Kaistia dalseonensis TaxID=410840 RepID=A0ABU0HC07_9HYPH|nr:5-(carboxyamino)imidazole ribonucleotide synthase [Kaistia dalseonensis]MCX5496886.1 5-(carboxyamino)imidazole ribonucleotide synthase [Kaistia dalseonensis]MDQ0439512.1 5-(carboxyamino)imidazole ribonucleotide synthase [Kaistia dalseonensis]